MFLIIGSNGRRNREEEDLITDLYSRNSDLQTENRELKTKVGKLVKALKSKKEEVRKLTQRFHSINGTGQYRSSRNQANQPELSFQSPENDRSLQVETLKNRLIDMEHAKNRLQLENKRLREDQSAPRGSEGGVGSGNIMGRSQSPSRTREVLNQVSHKSQQQQQDFVEEEGKGYEPHPMIEESNQTSKELREVKSRLHLLQSRYDSLMSKNEHLKSQFEDQEEEIVEKGSKIRFQYFPSHNFF